MRRLLAFVLGVAAVAGARALLPAPATDPLPSPSEVRRSIEQLRLGAPAAQRGAFSDGRVDMTEYREAVADRIACLQSRAGPGIEIIGPADLAGGRLLTWHYRVPVDRGETAATADRSCARELSDSVEQAWKLEAVPHGAARRREVGRLAACLRQRTVDVAGDDTASVLRGALNATFPVGDCVDPHAVLFDL